MPITRRSIYNPIIKPPATSTSALPGFPQEPRAHVSSEQFNAIRNPRGIAQPRDGDANFFGLLEDRHSKNALNALNYGGTPEERWASKAHRTDIHVPNIYSGRTVVVRDKDVGQAYSKLQAILKMNNVRRELKLTERHEKKGAKRRRLRSERWKRKFADEVRKKVKLVTEIRLRDRMWGASRH